MNDRFDEMAEQALNRAREASMLQALATFNMSAQEAVAAQVSLWREEIAAAIRTAVAAETERCAEIADEYKGEWRTYAPQIGEIIAATIRAQPPRDATKPLHERRCSACGAGMVREPYRPSARSSADMIAEERYACTCDGHPPLDDRGWVLITDATPAGERGDAVEWQMVATARDCYVAEWRGVRLEVFGTVVCGEERWGWNAELDAATCDGRKLERTLPAAKSAAESFARRIGAK